ncbi:hypothetical protein Hanom_Chr01g00003671 [Helianthus anomalus]
MMFLIFWIFWVLMMMFVLEDTDLSLVSFYKSVFVLISCCLYFDFCDGFWFCSGFLIFLKMMFLIFWIFWVLMMKFDDVLEDDVINY